MNVGDLFGLAVVGSILLAALYGLNRISSPVSYTKEEYEKRLRKGSGIARGAMNALMYPLEELLHPRAVKAFHVMQDIKAGRYDIQQANGDGLDEEGRAPTGRPDLPRTGGVKRRSSLLRLFLRALLSRR